MASHHESGDHTGIHASDRGPFLAPIQSDPFCSAIATLLLVLCYSLAPSAEAKTVSEELRDTLRAAAEAQSYEVVRQESAVGSSWEDLTGAYRADSRSTNLCFYFNSEGAHLETHTATDTSAGMRMVLAEYGHEGRLEPVPRVEPTAKGNRVEYHYSATESGPDLVEWFVNSSLGMEHGFTVPAPPDGSSGDELLFSFDIQGNVSPQLAVDGSTIVFHDYAGRTLFRYEKLHVFDAAGSILPARLLLCEGNPGISVDARGAVYPLTVDPLFENEVKLTAAVAVPGDKFGASVSISGDTAIVGAYQDE